MAYHSSLLGFSSLALLLVLLLALHHQEVARAQANPTSGFTSQALSQSNFDVQKPYDVPVNQRYSFVNGTHKMWVYRTDKPHSPDSKTMPRTEIRIRGYDYSSGIWQFEGQGYVPRGTVGASIMQVFGAVGHPTALMLKVYDGALKYYSVKVVASNIYDRWFRLNVIHDVDAGHLKVYVDRDLKLEVNDQGRDTHYFKFGVYAQTGASDYMESRWRNIRVLKKN